MPEHSHVAYLDHASMGLPSAGTRAAVSRLLEALARPEGSGTQRSLELFDAVERARRQVAVLLNVDPAYVLLVENTSRGIGLIASSLSLSAGDNVLVCDLEFLTATVGWRSVSRRLGVEVRAVKTQGGRVMVEDFLRVADKRSRVIVLSSVQEVTGFRSDLRVFGQLAEELGAFLIVDGIQEAGVIPVDLAATPVHAYCAGGSKWLRSPFGLGFLYIHPTLLERLSPPEWGYLALAEPEMGWEAYLQSPWRTPFDRLPESSGVRRLVAGGMPNAVGAVALENAVREAREFGQADAMRRVSTMRNSLIKELLDAGTEVKTADGGLIPEEQASGIVCLGLRRGVDAEHKLWRKMLNARVFVSLRYVSGIGGIRVAIHYDNTADDLHALMEVVRCAES